MTRYGELFDLDLIERQVSADHVGRGAVLDEIEARLAEPGCQIVLVEGGPGSGKTTLMAALANRRPEFLRYFIRRAGQADGRGCDGSLASFLTVAGLQLAALRPDLFPDEDLGLQADVHAEDVAAGATATGLWVKRWLLHPFRRFAAQVRLGVGTVEGTAIGVYIGEIGHAALEDPGRLEGPALTEPLGILGTRPGGGRVVIIIDGLDELRVRDAPADIGTWLIGRPGLPPGLQLVVSSRREAQYYEALRANHRDGLRVVSASSGGPAAVAEYAAGVSRKEHVGQVLRAYGLRREVFARRSASRAGANFQYVAFLDRALAAARAEDRGAAGLDWLGLPEDAWPNGIGDLYERFMTRVKVAVERTAAGQHAWDELYRPVLGLLAVASAPLTAAQLGAFTGIGDAAQCAAVIRRLDQFLAGDLGGGYLPFHRSVADYITGGGEFASLHCDEVVSHRRLTAHALVRHGPSGDWKTADPYLRTFLAGHAAAAGRLDELLKEPRFLVAATPAELLAALGSAGPASGLASLYRRAVPYFRRQDDAAALAHLHLFALEAGEADFARRIAAMPGDWPWRTVWTERDRGASRGVTGWHEAGITAIAVTDGPDGACALTGGPNGEVEVWNLSRGERGRSALRAGDGTGSGIRVLAVGELRSGEPLAAAGCWDGAVRAWNVSSGQPACAPLAGPGNAGRPVAVGAAGGPDGSRLAAVCQGWRTVRAWDILDRVPLGPPVPAREFVDAAIGVAAGRVLMAVVTIADGAQELRAWDAADGRPAGPPVRDWQSSLVALAIGEIDGEPVIAVADITGRIQLINAVTGEDQAGRPCHLDSCAALAVGTLLGRVILAAGDSSGKIYLWDVAAWKPAAPPVSAHDDGRVTALAIASETLVGAGVDRGSEGIRPVIRRWSAGGKGGLRIAGTEVWPDEEVVSIAAATGTMACCGDRTVRLLDITSGASAGSPLSGRSEMVRGVAAAILADGNPVIAGAAGSCVWVWDVESERLRYPPLDLGAECSGLAVTAVDGQPVLVGATHGSGVRLWDLATGRPAGAGRIDAAADTIAVTQFAGRAVGAFYGIGLVLADLRTGAVICRAAREAVPYPTALALSGDGDRLAVMIGSTGPGTVTACELTDDPAPVLTARRAVAVADRIDAIALTVVDGRPVALCAGAEGNLQVVDLPDGPGGPPARQPVVSLAITRVRGAAAVIRSRETQTEVIDLATGRTAAPPPAFRPGRDGALAVASLAGQPVAACSAAHAIHLWDPESGTAAPVPEMSCEGWVTAIAAGEIEGNAVVAAGLFDKRIRIFDLRTGSPVGEPVSCQLTWPKDVGLVTHAGHVLLVFNQDGDVRSRAVWPVPQRVDIEELLGRPDDFCSREDTPPPLRTGRRDALNRRREASGQGMALGLLDSTPVVLSGHNDGQVDVFALGSALPVGPALGLHDSEVTALAFADVNGRPVAASGATDGTVCLWDLADPVAGITISTSSRVLSVALDPSGHCVIGTQAGAVAIRFQLPARSSSRALIRVPADPRATAACPVHDSHVTTMEVGGLEVTRMCVKGVQSGRPKTDLLEPGHCYVVPGHVIYVPGDKPGWHVGDLAISLRHSLIEPEDVPHAYELDGGHFRINVDDPRGQFRAVCCYRRSDRDLLATLMAGQRSPRRDLLTPWPT